jgi:flagellar basal-body rod protein FlgC
VDFTKTMGVSAAGMRAQGVRMRVIAENLANASSLPASPDEDPYRRKMVTFKTELDRKDGVRKIRVDGTVTDKSAFSTRFDPSHPGSDVNGYVKLPNVNTLVELMDMREARRSYQANVSMIEAAKKMLLRTIDLLQ